MQKTAAAAWRTKSKGSRAKQGKGEGREADAKQGQRAGGHEQMNANRRVGVE